MKPFSSPHIQEVGVSACIELICSVYRHSPVKIKIDKSPVENSGPHLGFYIISDDGEVSFLEPFLSVSFARNEDRNTVDESACIPSCHECEDA